MKKLMVLGVAIITVLSMLLVGCESGPPKPPVSKLLDLDELVATDMTLDEVYALVKPELKNTSTLYQAAGLELTATGSWKVTSLEKGETVGDYQVLFFPPAKSGEDYLLVFFKENVVIGKAWFLSKAAAVMKAVLQGINYN